MKVVAISDLHTGSHWGLADPSVTGYFSAGKKIQERLFAKWKDSVTDPKWSNPDVLVLNGDCVDGQGRKDGGSHQWTTNVMDQVLHCADLVKMWNAKKIYVVGGSKYHVIVGQTGFSAEEILARELKAEEYPNQDFLPEEHRARSGLHWLLTFEGTTVHFSHHVGFSRVFAYMSSGIAREMMNLKLNDPMRHKWESLYQNNDISIKDFMSEVQQQGVYKTKIVVRGHTHYFWACDSGGTLGIILPGWQIPTPFMMERNALGFSHVGFVGFDFHSDGKYDWDKKLIHADILQEVPHVLVKMD